MSEALLTLNEDAVYALHGRPATYTPAGGAAQAITVLPKQEDQLLSLGDTRLVSETGVFLMRVAEVPTPTAGDAITYAGEDFTINGDPTRDDPMRRWWTVRTIPA